MLNTGPGDFVAHAHEGLELADASGFVAVSVFLAALAALYLPLLVSQW